MAIKLNKTAFNHAKALINKEAVEIDERDAWSEHQPSTREENEFIRLHGFKEYIAWHLGIDDEQGEDTKRRYKFPYGNFKKVHRCALLSAESRAGQYKHFDIENAEVCQLFCVNERVLVFGMGARGKGQHPFPRPAI